MRTRLIMLLIVALLSLECLSAQEEGAYKELTYGELTYEEFLSDPTPENFELLNPENQKRYISEIEYFAGENFQIGQEYFSGGADSVNENREAFSRFMSQQGVEIKVLGRVRRFDIDGTIEGANQKINLFDWKEKFSFKVDPDGNLMLISENLEHSFEGEIKEGLEGQMYLREGMIDGRKVIEGRLELEGSRIKGTANEFGEVVFFRDGEGTTAHIEYDSDTNTLKIINPYEGNRVFISRGKGNLNIESGFDGITIFREEGEIIAKGIVTYKQGQAVKILSLASGGGAMVEGISHHLHQPGTELYLCYDPKCMLEHGDENYFYYGEKELDINGEGFSSVLDKNALLDFKSKYGPKRALRAESFFFGRSDKEASDRYDFLSITPETGRANIIKGEEKLSGIVWGKASIENGYWPIASDGQEVLKKIPYNPQKQGRTGMDVFPLELNFNMDDGSVQSGYQFSDESGRPDLFKYPFAYTGISPDGVYPQSKEEFDEYFKFNLHLLKGQPVDFSDAGAEAEIPGSREFVCIDVVYSAYRMTTGINLMEDKARVTGTRGRRNSEFYSYFKTSDLFDTEEYDGGDFLGTGAGVRGRWDSGQRINPGDIILPPTGSFSVDWEDRYGLEREGGVQFIMFEKHLAEYDKGKVLRKTKGHPMYHIVPVYWDGKKGEWISIQAPGECRDIGVCEIPLDGYTNDNRCTTRYEGCYFHYGVNQVIKPKFTAKQ